MPSTTRRRYLAGVAGAAAGLAGCLGGGCDGTVAADGEWPLARHDPARTAHAAEIAVPDAPSSRWCLEPEIRAFGRPVVAPRVATDAGPGGDARAGDPMVYVGADAVTDRARTTHRLYAVNGRTGTERWHVPFRGEFGGAPAVTPAAVVVSVAAGLERGRLVALGRRYGDERWLVPVDARVTAAPTVAGGAVYLPDWSGRVRAVAVGSGDTRWERRLRVDGSATTLAGAAAVGDGRVFVGSHAGWTGVAALDADSGETLWTRSTGAVTGGPVVTGGRLLVRSHRSVVCLDAATGERRWTWNLQREDASAFAADGERAYLPAGDRLVALSLGDGERDWERSLDAGAVGSPVVAGDAVLSGGEDRLVALDRATGERRWSVAEPGTATPVDGAVYVTGEGTLAALG